MTSPIIANSFPAKQLCATALVASAQSYPSPSLSPVTTFKSSMDTLPDRRRSSVKSLMNSANPPASPLDALVLALEATAEEMNSLQNQDLFSTRRIPEDEEEDPNATEPSSPTLFMKRSVDNAPSLHQLPSLVLPAAAVSSYPSSVSSVSTSKVVASGLTPSTHPVVQPPKHRKMSTSSQGSIGSVSSTNSSGDRIKEFACTIGGCEKKFYQVAHLRIHER
ncbi:hypothetical protein BGZ83_010194, partial [Gryganskiella cystojenkinii]